VGVSKRRKRWLVCGGILVIAGGLYQVMTILNKPTAAQIFHRFVSDPIPTSVTNIQADCPRDDGVGGYVYVLRFGIGRSDLDAMIGRHPFKESSSGYSEFYGWLSWVRGQIGNNLADRINVMTEIYKPDQRQPLWLDLGSWQSPETYVWEPENGMDPICFLIYNKDAGCAYVIAQHSSNSSIFNWSGVKNTYEWK
jgi:hypothetical protein